MNSEKVKEIKKALECCAKGLCGNSCPRFNKKCININCQDEMNSDVLTYINELESENERYKQSCGAIGQNSLTIINQFKDRIAELEEQRDRQAYIAEDLTQEKHRWAEQARKGTAKQFVERLKRKVTIRHEFEGDFSILVNTIEYVKVEDIDETLKEFLEK